MAEYIGDFPEDAVFHKLIPFKAGGELAEPSSLAVAAYKNNSETQTTTGVTISDTSFDSIAGLVLFTIDTSDAFYATGSEISIVATAGTLASVSLVGDVMFSFSIERSGAALALLKHATFGLSALETLVDGLEGDVTTLLSRIVGTLATGTHQPQSGDAYARLGAPAGASVSADIAAIEAQTDDIGVAGAGLTAIPTIATVTNVTTVNGLAANVITAAAIAADAAPELRGALVAGTADSGSTTSMVDAALTEADADYWKGCFILFTSGTIAGQCRLITAFTPGTDTVTFAPATTQAVSTNTYEILPAARVDLQLWLGSVANALVSGRVDASTGAVANDAITAAAIANGAIDAATFASGAIDNTAFNVTEVLNANVQQWNGSAVATPSVAGVPEVDITHIDGTAHGSTQIRSNAVQWAGAATATDDIALKATLAKGTDITGFNDLSAAAVNAEVVDALSTDTYAEPGQGAPAATASLAAKIGYLFKAWRNRNTATTTQYSLYADDATTVDQKATLSDSAGTTEKAEIVSGP